MPSFHLKRNARNQGQGSSFAFRQSPDLHLIENMFSEVSSFFPPPPSVFHLSPPERLLSFCSRSSHHYPTAGTNLSIGFVITCEECLLSRRVGPLIPIWRAATTRWSRAGEEGRAGPAGWVITGRPRGGELGRSPPDGSTRHKASVV